MEKTIKLLGTLFLVVCITIMFSCNREDVVSEIPEEETATGVTVTVTAGVNSTPATKSALVTENNKYVLKFTEGDRLFVWRALTPKTSPAKVPFISGFLNMVGSPSADGRSATFTGTLQAYDSKGYEEHPYDYGDNPLEGATATLVHAGLIEWTDYWISPVNNWMIDFTNISSDVESFMTSYLHVTGVYNSETHGFMLGCTDPVFNCYISGLQPSENYYASFISPLSDQSILLESNSYSFTTDEKGFCQITIALDSKTAEEYNQDNTKELCIMISSHNIEVGRITWGNKTLENKIYNVKRWFNGTAFCTPTNLSSIDINALPSEGSGSMERKYYTVSDGEMLTGTLSPDCKLKIPDGFTVVLAGVTHHAGNCVNGLECLGTANIFLVPGTINDLRHGDANAYDGIFMAGAYTKTLTISGGGTLVADGGGNSAGIGAGDGANLVINNGQITATGGLRGAGIGTDSEMGKIGNITINGGTITASGTYGAGIGCGYGETLCGDITFNGGTVIVNGMVGKRCKDIRFNGGSVTVYGSIEIYHESSYNDNNYIFVNNKERGKTIYYISSPPTPFVYPENP